MLSRELEVTLNLAFQVASEKRHEFMTVEHLLLALLDDASAGSVLRACKVDVNLLRKDLTEFLEATTPILPEESADVDTQPSLGFQRVLQRAIFNVQSSGKSEVAGANVLAAIFSEQESQAVYLLRLQNVGRIDVVNYISHGIAKGSEESSAPSPKEKQSETSEGDDKESLLEQFSTNLNVQAEKGKIDPLIGRDQELERVCQILSRRRKNNPLLVGEAGVGKTAIAEGLAMRIVHNEVPELLADAVIFSLDMGSILAGTKYRGDFEKRFKGILAELKNYDKAVLFIDEIHTIIGAGAASGGVMDASNLLKPLLTSGNIRCIGSTTYQEYRGIFDKDHALSRRFQKVDIPEPSEEETVEILKGLKSRFEEHHDIRYSQAALKAAVSLSNKYINDRFLPDKAIDVIDEAGARQRLMPENKRKKILQAADIEEVVAGIARIPVKSVSSSDKEQLRGLADKLNLVVFGQEKAIDALASSIKLARAGLRDSGKPIGSFLFAGPTGVGKTEVCKQLAHIMGIELIRFDMSEYMERHTVSRLIGAPPGYVGYDQGGLLTEAVTKHPHSVVLLDEIEKAHPELFNILLQVMDHGTLTDNNGRKADFRNVILVMTTNAGAQEASRASIGFTQQDHSTDAMESIKKLFTPEFRNRLDAVIQFGALTTQIIESVVDKFLTELQAQLDEKRVFLHVDDSARAWFAVRGYDEAMGARPMARLIQEHLKKPLAELVLFGELSEKGGEVEVTVEDGELRINIMQAEPV